MKNKIVAGFFIVSLILIISIASAGWIDVLKQIFGIGEGDNLGGELGTISPTAADYTCTETDGGRDYNNYGETKGIMYGTSSDYQIKYDACSTARYGNKVLVEFYCESNRVMSESHICDYICENGECISCTPSCMNASCGDDGCGGSCGACSAGYSCQNGQCVLMCVNDPGCSYLGSFCDGNIPYTCSRAPYGCLARTNLAACSSGYNCINGQCVNQGSADYTCTETDYGLDYNNKGTTTGKDVNGIYGSKTDECLTERFYTNRLKEYYCFDNRLTEEIFQCDASCVGGRCINIIEDQFVKDNMIWDLPELYGFIYRGEWHFQQGTLPFTHIDLRYISPMDNDQHSEFALNIYENDLSDSFLEAEFEQMQLTGLYEVSLKEINGNKVYEGTSLDGSRDVFWISGRYFIRGWNGNDIGTVVDNDLFDVLLNGYLKKYPSTYKGTANVACSDSDGGIDYYTQGKVNGKWGQNNEASLFFDSCSECDSNWNCNRVSEYYCNDSELVDLQDYPCPYGCSDGACIKDLNLDYNELEVFLYPPILFTPELDSINFDSNLIGDIIIIDARLISSDSSFDINSIKSSKFEVFRQNQLIFSDELNLLQSDLFTTGGVSLIFQGEWLTSDIEEGQFEYQVRLIFELKNGKPIEEIRNFKLNFKKPDTTKCKELISGHNKPEADRANIVVLFGGYEELTSEQRVQIAQDAVDFEGISQGIFSVEPFRSNKDKFNLWYVDQNFDILDEFRDSRTIIDEENPCVFNNRFPVKIINQNFRSSADFGGGDSTISAEIYLTEDCSFAQYCEKVKAMKYDFYDYNSDGMQDELDFAIILKCSSLGKKECVKNDFFYRESVPIGNTVVHEFGHQFGNLRDEYFYSGTDTFYKDVTSERNCYAGQLHTREECLENAQWKNYIGQGEGDLKIDCFEGCEYMEKGIFRSAYCSIMHISSQNNYGFGLWNEHLIQQELDKYTGV